MANVNIKFNNKEFLLSCEDGQEEHLEELSVHLNEKFNDYIKRFNIKVLNSDLPCPFRRTFASLGTFSFRTNCAGRFLTSIGISEVIVYSFSLITNNHNKKAKAIALSFVEIFCQVKKE